MRCALPISALFRKGSKWAVYVIERGRARTVPVEIGQRNPDFAEVLKGIAGRNGGDPSSERSGSGGGETPYLDRTRLTRSRPTAL